MHPERPAGYDASLEHVHLHTSHPRGVQPLYLQAELRVDWARPLAALEKVMAEREKTWGGSCECVWHWKRPGERPPPAIVSSEIRYSSLGVGGWTSTVHSLFMYILLERVASGLWWVWYIREAKAGIRPEAQCCTPFSWGAVANQASLGSGAGQDPRLELHSVPTEELWPRSGM